MYCANLKQVLKRSDLTGLAKSPWRVIPYIGKLMLTDRPRPPGPESS
jgi:hypothetical protein